MSLRYDESAQEISWSPLRKNADERFLEALLCELDQETAEPLDYEKRLAEYAPTGASYEELLEHFKRFILDAFGKTLTFLQEEIAYSVIACERTAISSGHSTGKTALLAMLAEWWFSCRGFCVWVTGSGREAVRDGLWAEVGRNREVSRIPLPGAWHTEGVRPDDKQKASGWWGKVKASNTAERAQGVHLENLLIIVDEAAGAAEHTWLAVESSMASDGVRLAVAGNPNPDEMTVYSEIFTDEEKSYGWQVFEIASWDGPNFTPEERTYLERVVPLYLDKKMTIHEVREGRPSDRVADADRIGGLASFPWVLRQLVRYRDEPDWFFARVWGKWPRTRIDKQIIPAYYIEAAMELWKDLEEEEEFYPTAPPMGGAFLDVAYIGNDRSALVFRRGQRLHIEKWWSDRSDEGLMLAAEYINGWICGLPKDEKPRWVAVDCNAVGAGVHSRLYQLRKMNRKAWGRCRLVRFNWSYSTTDPARFVNIVSELYWKLREALDPSKPYEERLAVPPGVPGLNLTRRELWQQLNTRRYKRDNVSRVKSETKDEMKARGGISPDLGDAFAGLMYDPPIASAAVG